MNPAHRPGRRGATAQEERGGDDSEDDQGRVDGDGRDDALPFTEAGADRAARSVGIAARGGAWAPG
ncbi:hypothetical protein ACIQFU_31355 [Streptomyces sp. NPDC093065]|uniref:hypothetical protein n=1 Tax=Streptomyces sp. NPDC093065 TaxID=3366021 RepID=UPI00381530D3